MFLTRSEYDRGVNSFSPEGRLFQLASAIGTATTEGVVLAVEKRITSSLMEPTIEKMVEIDEHVDRAAPNLMADSLTEDSSRMPKSLLCLEKLKVPFIPRKNQRLSCTFQGF
jgi:hypothetical protein